ncbi:MAG: hypothetical protein JEY99_08790 [Spirochaetales bacterium]|nr:hypothetical protein [Spirochaetales bacterium]
MILSGAIVGLAYGSFALATLGCIIFGLVHWDKSSEDLIETKKDTGDSAVA